jgi:hypothetical protein
MKIFEEYIYRHNLDLDIIKHTQKGVVVLKNKVIININWQNQKNTIGFYNFNECKFIYNYIKPFKFNKILWCDYEEFIKIWTKNNSVFALNESEDVFYFFWNIFLRSNKINIKLKNTKDADFLIKKTRSKIFYSSWKFYERYIDNYCYWFSDLINESLLERQFL